MRMNDVTELASETDKRLSVHEAICAERYQNIQARFDDGSKRMSRIEYILYALIAVTLLGPGFAAKMIEKLMGV